MSAVIYSDEYRVLVGTLLRLRQGAGLSQRELSRRMRRSATHIHKIEIGQRRVELIEFCAFVRVCGSDPVSVFGEVHGLIDQCPTYKQDLLGRSCEEKCTCERDLPTQGSTQVNCQQQDRPEPD